MRWWIPFFAVLTVWAADQPAEKRAAPPAAATSGKTARPAPLTLPAGAVEVAPGTYSYTDPQGKHWTYRQTPFGLARLEGSPDAAGRVPSTRPAAAVPDQTTAIEDGDGVRFTRPGPFGTYSWRRKKSELDETEKAAWDRARAKNAPAKEAQE